MLWNSYEISEALGISLPDDIGYTGISIDSRTIKPGDIFVAIKGGKQDGHEYVADAFSKGAKLAIVSTPTDGNTILVNNTLEALENIAAAARDRFDGKVIAITGSVGKTSTKTAVGMVLTDQGTTYVSPGGFNNQWGVPLSVANLPRNFDYGVFEVGMNHTGEIDHLTKFIKPDIAVITNVENVHIANFDHIEQIADAKAEIYNHVDNNCIAVLNNEHKFYNYLYKAATSKGLHRFVTFGSTPQSTVQLLNWEQLSNGLNVVVAIHHERYEFNLKAFGRHWVINGLGVIAVAHAAGINITKACESLSNFKLLPGRGDMLNIDTPNGALTIIDESYNSSPIAIESALTNLSIFPGRKIAVLGDMLELGESAESEHLRLKNLIKSNGIDLVFTSGPLMKKLYDALPEDLRGAHNDDPASLGNELFKHVKDGDHILIKGSRGNYGPRGRMHNTLENLIKLSK